ncbi:MAG: carboxypeptidase M32 [Actinomycetota bacterium]
MTDAWDRFKSAAEDLENLGSAIKLANWDQEVMMPVKGGEGRARVLATLQALAHERLTDPRLGDLLDELGNDADLDAVQSASVRIMKKHYDRATRVPEALVRELAELEATAFQAWTRARPANDFSILEPYLTKMLALKKEQADAIGWEGERYDALLDEYEPDMKTAEIEAMFEDLEVSLRPIVDKVVEAAGEPPSFVDRPFDSAKQKFFSDWLVQELGFDTAAGRLDTSPHPFTMPIGPGDVRQTTKMVENELMMSLYATIHETGHALYEQNLPPELGRLPAGQVPSLGLHESQSRLWENQVGRSHPFCGFLFTKLSEMFPAETKDIDADLFYRGASHPQRTLIRITADELTYNLHVALRFQLELAMFRDDLDVADLPGAWNEGMQRWVGITPPTDSEGVMQDMHWSIGALGYFPTYTLGTLYAAAFFEKAEADLGSLTSDLAKGDTTRLFDWLKANVFSQAYLYPAKELGQRILGAPLEAAPFIDYLKKKYGELYDVTLD